MKKLFSIILMAVMVFAMTISVCAAPGGFIQSPSTNSAPTLEDFSSSDSNWNGEIYITSYRDRNVLELVERDKMEAAYESIRNAPGVSSLNSELSGIAANINVSADNLGISDLFHVSASDISDGTFSIKLKSETLSNFVGLIYYEDSQWHIVDGAKVEGEYLTFTTDVPRALAVVVDVDNSVIDVPVTGDIIPWVLVAIMAASVTGIVILLVTYRKNSKV